MDTEQKRRFKDQTDRLTGPGENLDMAISRKDFDAVVERLGVGEPHRQIAAATGVSRYCIGKINKGRYKYQKEELVLPSGPYVWCPGCRHDVQMPCLACRVRAMKK